MLLTEKAAPYLEKTKGNVIVISSNLSVRTVSSTHQGLLSKFGLAANEHGLLDVQCRKGPFRTKRS